MLTMYIPPSLSLKRVCQEGQTLNMKELELAVIHERFTENKKKTTKKGYAFTGVKPT